MLLEAMLAALPVVATRVSAVPEIVADGETGLLAPAGDARRSLRTSRRSSTIRSARRALGDERLAPRPRAVLGRADDRAHARRSTTRCSR